METYEYDPHITVGSIHNINGVVCEIINFIHHMGEIETVLFKRDGQYYKCSYYKFINSLDKCQK
jgi:hypothetical protein